MSPSTQLLAVLAAAAILPLATIEARAGCHLVDCVENVRITAAQVGKRSCEDLWVLRNSIYKDAGYCFQSERGRKWFGNQGCKHRIQMLVPLSSVQKHNVSVLKGLEKRQGC